jgi:transmembrane sensor
MNGPMKSADSRSHSQAAAQAAAWVARRDQGLTMEEEREFARWSANEQNRQALDRTSRLWSLLERPREAGASDGMIRELASRARGRTRRRTAIGAAMALAALGGFLSWRFAPANSAPAAELAATEGGFQQQALPDGSRIDLKTGAAVEVRFSPAVRRVDLDRGEALFHVAKNPVRPFVVSAGGVEVRAVGTIFAVQFEKEDVAVLVTEGRVAVSRAAQAPGDAASDARPVTYVDAGNRVVLSRLPSGGLAALPAEQAMTPAESDRWLAWRYPRLEFSGTRLAEAVALFNRHSATDGGARLVVGDAELADLEVSGYFRANNVDGFVRLLEGSFGVKAVRGPSGEIVLRHAN